MEFKLCHNNLEQLIKLGFNINWTLLQIGYYGSEFILPQFTAEDVIKYAAEQLNSVNDILIERLACSENDSYEFRNILARLVSKEKVSKEMQMRKLRVLILYKKFANIPNNYIDGLVELTEIWVSLGLPDDCPHIVQGRGNSLSSNDYYTEEMYETLKKRNFDWLDNEISCIIFKENLNS